MSERFLIVDDDPTITEALAKIIGALGYEVILHSDPIEAVKETDFDVVLTDFMMPGLSGVELLRSLRQRNAEAVRLMITAANDFKVTTLHEIGHSIDDKQNIMKSNMGNAGCGKWQSESIAKITAAYLPELRKAAAVPVDLPDRLVSSLITGALLGNVAKPGIVTDADWARIAPWLATHCTAILHTNEPWEKTPVPVALGTGNRPVTPAAARFFAWSPGRSRLLIGVPGSSRRVDVSGRAAAPDRRFQPLQHP